ncbi:hypothetical protein QA596_03375 [Balneolales bacterium ANBcel1]|nr:hypothetical protein [Balneolales bacterium ANBcel1]
MKPSADREIILSDLAYLIDELEALKSVIDAIPYRDRPMEQESVLDIVSHIDSVQSVFLEKIVRKCVIDDDGASPIAVEVNLGIVLQPETNPAGKTDRHADPAANAEPDETLFDLIIANRKELLVLLETHQKRTGNRKIVARDREWLFYDILQELVTLDRDQLRKVAERVQAIDTDRSIKPESH